MDGSSIQIFIVLSCGVLGGLVNGLISAKSLKIHCPTFQKKSKIFDTGWLGFSIAGIAGSIVVVGIFGNMGGISIVSLSPEVSLTRADLTPVVYELLATLPQSELSMITKAIETHNVAVSKQYAGADIKAYAVLASYSVLGGYGGSSILTIAYNKILGQELQSSLEDQQEKTEKLSLEADINTARELMDSHSFNAGIKLCDAHLGDEPSNIRLNGIKARGLRALGDIDGAIKCLRVALKAQSEEGSALPGFVKFNLALYIASKYDYKSIPKKELETILYHLKAAYLHYPDVKHRVDESVSWAKNSDNHIETLAQNDIDESVDRDIVLCYENNWFRIWYDSLG